MKQWKITIAMAVCTLLLISLATGCAFTREQEPTEDATTTQTPESTKPEEGTTLPSQTPEQPTQTEPTTTTPEPDWTEPPADDFELHFEPDRAELADISLVEELRVDMSLREVCELLGWPQRDIGSGGANPQWDLRDGEVLTLMLSSPRTGDWHLKRWSVEFARNPITEELALAIAKDRIEKYNRLMMLRACCDYELVMEDMSQYISEIPEEGYYDYQYQLACCHTPEEVRAHIDRILDPSLNRGYPDDKLFTDDEGNLYLIVLPTGGGAYDNIRVAEFDDDHIVATAEEWDYGTIENVATFVIEKERDDFIIREVDIEKVDF